MSNNQNSQILTPNSANSTSTSHNNTNSSNSSHHGLQRQQDTPPVSPNSHYGSASHHNRQLLSYNSDLGNNNSTNSIGGLLNVNQSIWSPANVKFEPNMCSSNPNFNLNANHHLITAAAAAAAAAANSTDRKSVV